MAQAALNPGQTLKLILGPDLTRDMFCICSVIVMAASLLGVLMVLYYAKVVFM